MSNIYRMDVHGNWTLIGLETGGGGSDNYFIGDATPTSPQRGDRWFDSSIGIEFLYYSDTWVETDNSSTGGGGSGVTGPTGPTGPGRLSPVEETAGRDLTFDDIGKVILYTGDWNEKTFNIPLALSDAATPGDIIEITNLDTNPAILHLTGEQADPDFVHIWADGTAAMGDPVLTSTVMKGGIARLRYLGTNINSEGTGVRAWQATNLNSPYYVPWTGWSTTLTGISNTIKNSNYTQIGNTVTFIARIEADSGGFTWDHKYVTMTLPTTLVDDIYDERHTSLISSVMFYDQSASLAATPSAGSYEGIARYDNTTSTLHIMAASISGSYVRPVKLVDTVPFTWSSGDLIIVRGTYTSF